MHVTPSGGYGPRFGTVVGGGLGPAISSVLAGVKAFVTVAARPLFAVAARFDRKG